MVTKKTKPTKKSSSTKKTSAAKKPTIAKAATKKLTALKTTFTKSQLLANIAEEVNLTKAQVASVLDSCSDIIERHIKKRAVGEFTLPGLLKIKTIKKPATKARKGINPFTKEEMMFKAKPARTSVKILALKKLKAMVE